MSNQSPLRTLKGTLRGDLIEPGDARYDEVRKVYNGMIDKRPLAIAMCLDVADVSAAVLAGADHGLPVAIRGGGHNAGGLGICNDGLVIDLSHMKQVEVDAAAKTVRVEGGALWRDVDAATHAHGLAVPAGIISTTGVGGLSLGGGIGPSHSQVRPHHRQHRRRRHGACRRRDGRRGQGPPRRSVLGDPRRRRQLRHRDRVHVPRAPDPHRLSPARCCGRSNGRRRSCSGIADFLPKQPDELNGFFAFLTVPPGPPFPEALHLKPMCGIVWCYVGPPDQADKVFAPIRALKPALDLVGPIPHPAVQSMFDPLLPPGLQWYWKADFVKELPSAAIDRQRRARREDADHAVDDAHVSRWTARRRRVGRDETPWAYRDARWAQVIVGIDPDPANRDAITAWTKNYFDAIHPYSAGGAYVNFMMDEGEDRVKATYRDHYPRLASVKAKYDPANLFRVNQNIKPAATAV